MDDVRFGPIIPIERIEGVIYFIRGHKIILDKDLAALYGVKTKALNQAVLRNAERFPEDFAFRLTSTEWNNLRSQIVTSSSNYGGHRYLPMAFSEYGALMAANILRSKRALHVSIEIVRTFARMTYTLRNQQEISNQLTELKSFLLKHSHSNDREFKKLWDAFEQLAKPPEPPRRIGFDLGYPSFRNTPPAGADRF